MGESILDASPSTSSPNLEDKMGETAPSNPALEVSVSFGRFEKDSLSWEKWSSFSPNKYLEEVEKCATPGSVAKKAAYFEAHYKKIAARKAEMLDQEKQMDNDSSGVDNQTCRDLNCKNNSETDISDCQRSDEVVYQETCLATEVRETIVDEQSGGTANTVQCQSLSGEGVTGEESRLECPTSDKLEENVNVTVKEEVGYNSMVVENVKELQEKQMEPTSNIKDEVNLDRPKDSHKNAPMIKERNSLKMKSVSPMAKPSTITKASPVVKVSHSAKSSAITKASPIAKTSHMAKSSTITKATPIAKVPQLSTPRVSKPTKPSTLLSTSSSSTKMGNDSSLSRSKNLSAGQSKKVAPKSLHMSLSLGPSSSDPASLTTTRKSLIMEQMADKDIVKRAFKTFQNNYNQLKSANEERSPASKQAVPAKAAAPRVSTLITPRKENTGSFRAAGVEKKSAKAAPSFSTLKSDERAEKKREFSKKEQTNTREADKPRPQTKSKENKEVGIRKVRQSLSSKATLIPSLHHGKSISKCS